MEKIDSEKALLLMLELFKAHPWLNEPGLMRDTDASAEEEGLTFLLAADFSEGWSGCSPVARRIACSLLLDFMQKLKSGRMTNHSWWVDETQVYWRQALDLIGAEIRRSHPHLKSTH